MIILGIDTSCDDTSIALIEEDKRVIVNYVSSQVDIHSLFGGVVPEIASRKHAEIIDGLYKSALKEASIKSKDIGLIAVTSGPGLIGSILVGLSFAKGLSLSKGIPLIAVNHVEAHGMSIFLEKKIGFPFVALVVSGGHTVIMLMKDFCDYTLIGSTRDDAAGEALDKIAKYSELGYPGGRIIEELSMTGDRDYYHFPRPMLDEGNYDFSFSGLKTSFINYVKKYNVTDKNLNNILSSFQEAVCDVLVSKTIKAALDYKIMRIVVGGGVAANRRLRTLFLERANKVGLDVEFSSPFFCTDNGAMVAILGYYYHRQGITSPLDVKAFSRMVYKKGL